MSEIEKQYKAKLSIGNKDCICSRFGDALETIKIHLEEASNQVMTVSVIKMTDEELSKIDNFDGW